MHPVVVGNDIGNPLMLLIAKYAKAFGMRVIFYDVNKKYSNIYNYNYEYILGPADKVFIDLTDTDDLDGTYLIDQEGMIDLPFIGKVKLDDLTLMTTENLFLTGEEIRNKTGKNIVQLLRKIKLKK